MPLQYYNLLEKPDWYQAFNGNANVETQLPYTLKTGVGRVARQFVNDAPPGLGGQSMQLSTGSIECELITDTNNAYPRPQGQSSKGATYEFWIKIPSGYTLSQNYKLLFRERSSQGYTIWDRIGITPDWRIFVWGSNNGGNGNGYLMGSGIIQTEPLAFDTWHHISVVYADDTLWSSSTALTGYANVFLYHNGILSAIVDGTTLAGARQSATTGDITSSNFYSFGWDFSGGDIFSGEIGNTGGFFSQDNGPGIPFRIAGFAQWMKSAQTQKQIARRYMFGIGSSKNRQKDLVAASVPWFACDMNNVGFDGTNETFQNQFGTNVTSGGSWGTSIQTGQVTNLTFKNPDSLEGNGISQTTAWTNSLSGQVIFDGTKSGQLQTLHDSGNMSVECWVKWGHTKNSFKPTKAAAGPISIMLTPTLVSHNIRTTSNGNIEFIDRYNDVAATYAPNYGPWAQGLLTGGDWVHIAATYQNVGGTVTIRYYLNGRQINTRTVTGNLSNPVAGAISQLTLFFAAQAAQAEPKTMDIFAIYDRALTSSEVRSRYLNYAALDRTVLYWDGVKWKVPTANKYWNGTEWAFWNDKVKHWDGDSWEVI